MLSIIGRYDPIILALFLIIFLTRFYLKTQTPYIEGQKVIIRSCLSEEPAIQNNLQKFKIEGIYVNVSDDIRFHYGDCLYLSGTLKRKVITFFYSQFLLINQEIVKKSPNEERSVRPDTVNHLYSPLIGQVYYLNNFIRNIYYRTFSAPQSQLLAGIVLGAKENFSPPFFQALQNSGLLHLVAASGMNLVIFVASVLNWLSCSAGRKKALVLTFGLIWFYAFLSGLQFSIIRAGIMLSLVYLGQWFGRGSSRLRLLMIAGGVMLTIWPLAVFDIGFWLSVSATAGLVVLGPVIDDRWQTEPHFRRIFRKLEKIGLSQSITESGAAYLATLPLILIAFHRTNPLALIPNVLVLWLIPYLMVGGGITAALGLIWLPLAKIGLFLWPGLTYLIWVIELFGKTLNLSITTPNIGYFNILFIFLYYLVLIKLFKVKPTV